MSWWNPFKNKKSQPKDISKKFLIVGLGNIGIDYALQDIIWVLMY